MQTEQKESKWKQFRNRNKLYFAAAITAWVILMFLHPVMVNGEAMTPTIDDGQLVIVAKHTYKSEAPPRYSVVDFNRDFALTNVQNANEVRRVVGLPGETVEIRNGAVWINGEADQTNRFSFDQGETMKPVLLEEGQVFVLSDNLKNKIDSRTVGPLEMKEIRGTCVFTLWPIGKIGSID